MRSFLLPTPLLTPEDWPKLSPEDVWILPLDVATVAGGRLREWFLEIVRHKQNLWYLPAKFLSETSDVNRQIRLNSVREWLSLSGPLKGERADLFSDDSSFIQNRLSLFGLRRAAVAAPSLFDWAKEIFLHFVLIAGELKLREALTDYQRELPDADAFPWEGLRFFAGFIRKRHPELATEAALDWARFQALYSPQDEVAEEAALQSQTVIVNPTIQFHRGEKEMIAVGRYGRQKIETRLDWRDALILDEIMEAPRSRADVILRNCEIEQRVGDRTFQTIFDELVLNRIILIARD